MSRRAALPAPAKLNLALAVLGKRPDGYHDLRSVFVTTDLHDDVFVAAHKRLEVRTTVDVGPDDLSARAARALAAACGCEPHVFIRVRKRIPLAAGLGGGSSDAGAVLRACAALWRCETDLVSLGASVGSDVPFFASAVSVALVSGRGERVVPLPAPRDPLHVVLVRPPLRLRTHDVFAAFSDADRGAERHVDAVAEAFATGTVTPELIRVHAENDLLAAAERRCEAIATWRAAAAARGVRLALTGSGPALYAIADDRGDALRIARILTRAGLRARAHTACG